MTMAICTVLTGNKYSVDHVNTLFNSLKENTTKVFDFYCYTDHEGLDPDIKKIPLINTDKKLQWYKLDYFKKGFVENVNQILMDIDLDIVGNVDFLFEDYEGFVGTHRWWWRWREDREAKLNKISPEDIIALSGTVYKFKNGEYQYIVDTFEQDIPYWQEYFIKNKTTVGPVNGEQHFVQKMLTDNNANFSYFNPAKIIKWHKTDIDMQMKLENSYYKWTNNEYIENDNWHDDIRIVHYAGS
jgi:hypothetical protein